MEQGTRSANPFSNIAAGLLLLCGSLLYLYVYDFRIEYVIDLPLFAILGFFMLAGLNRAVPVLFALIVLIQSGRLPGRLHGGVLTGRQGRSASLFPFLIFALIFLTVLIWTEEILPKLSLLWFFPGLLVIGGWFAEKSDYIFWLFRGSRMVPLEFWFQLLYPPFFGFVLLIYGGRFRKKETAALRPEEKAARYRRQGGKEQRASAPGGSVINGFETGEDRYSLGGKKGNDLWDRH